MGALMPLAQQPGLRPFVVCDTLPDACILFEVTDTSQEPHLHRGDFVVVDTTERQPFAGEFVLRQCADGSRSVVEVQRFRTDKITLEGGKRITEPWWSFHWTNLIGTVTGRGVRGVRFFDGPYATGNAAKCIVGTVVGIYQPDFQRHLRVAVV